jgi:hypothetical protein
MIRKSIGTILVIAAGVLAVILLTNGLIFPHLIGPITLAVIGVILLARKSNADQTAG